MRTGELMNWLWRTPGRGRWVVIDRRLIFGEYVKCMNHKLDISKPLSLSLYVSHVIVCLFHSMDIFDFSICSLWIENQTYLVSQVMVGVTVIHLICRGLSILSILVFSIWEEMIIKQLFLVRCNVYLSLKTIELTAATCKSTLQLLLPMRASWTFEHPISVKITRSFLICLYV